MKPLLVLARITFVGCLWSIIFIEGMRVVMLESWHFDIFWPPHWLHAWNLWSSGWVIDTPKEWAFILIIIAFIPMLLTGWVALSLIPWEHLIWKTVSYPVNFIRSLWKPIKIVAKQPVIVKRKSYKEIRPAGPRAPIYDYSDSPTPPSAASTAPSYGASATSAASAAGGQNIKDKAATARETFSHSLFNLDDEDDDFDLDFDSFEKSDIFKIDSSKKQSDSSDLPDKKEKRPAKSNRYEYDDDDEDYNRESRRKNDRNRKEERRYDDDDDHRSRRRSYNDDEDEDDNFRRRDSRDYSDDSRSDNRKKDNRRDRREDRRSGNETKAERRRDSNNGRDNKNESRKPAKENAAISQHNNPVADILVQKGYDVISNITIKNTLIDFAGVAEDKICLCLIDKEAGDWLADEERFNDEEPLWFSESSHRISPVRKIDLAARALSDKLADSDNADFEIKPFVVIQMGNIINAEDMFDVWNDIGVEVTRINRGSPKEIKLFSKSLEEADGKLGRSALDTLKKLMRNIT